MLKNWLLNILYPSRCPLCRASVDAHGQWCHVCTEAYVRPRQLHLPRSVRQLDRCYAVTPYHGPMRRLIHALKYDGKRQYAAACHYGLRQFPWSREIGPVDCVVPVPLAPEKEKSRGFNQTELIFRPWAEQYAPWADMLQRIRATASQWELTKQERADNIKRAFTVKGSFRVTQKRILLVDDIFTTGATLENCAAALHEKGAAAVIGLVLASDAPVKS